MTTFIVIDFETNGIDADSERAYAPHAEDDKPLPFENVPMQLAAARLDAEGRVEKTVEVLVDAGATRVVPWVARHCPTLTVERCRTEGVSMTKALELLSDLTTDPAQTTLVAHNLAYDWDDVIVATVVREQLKENESFKRLAACSQYCTCINPYLKSQKQSYYHTKLQKWLGPALSKLARYYDVEYEAELAHDAAYDVSITAQCFANALKKGHVRYGSAR